MFRRLLSTTRVRAAKTVQVATGVPTFGALAAEFVATHEGSWRNAKPRRQWRQTLTAYCGSIWNTPVNEIGIADVLTVLKPLWGRAPQTAKQAQRQGMVPSRSPRTRAAYVDLSLRLCSCSSFHPPDLRKSRSKALFACIAVQASWRGGPIRQYLGLFDGLEDLPLPPEPMPEGLLVGIEPGALPRRS